MMRCAIGLFGLAFLIALGPTTVHAQELTRGDRMLDAYFRQQTNQIADACLADVKTRADWEKLRPELRRQFFDMIGLWPLPPRTDLRPVVTGKIDADDFTIEKLHFQSSPDLYVTGNLYVPKKANLPAPAVLYVCGHANTEIDKVSFGSKVNYQHHPAWFAANGYVCLVVDTLQLGEIMGIHHGTSRENGTSRQRMWWWQARGYTPAGIECWNAMRAIDYLQSRKEVDPQRIGVTGRSGGGATSWWLAAADDRVQCIIPVAGIADLKSHVIEGVAPRLRKGVVSGHCDCMYFINTYRWDFGTLAALCAPRPLMLGNSDSDDIFPVPGYRAVADKARKIYDLYGAGDRFVLLETAGPHRDTPELRLGAFRWMDRWLKGHDDGTQKDPERPRFAPQQLKVFERLPEGERNTAIHETFVKPGSIELPRVPEVTREWWKGKRPEWERALREQVFRNWPAAPPALDSQLAADVTHDGLRLRAFDFTSEEGVPLRLWLRTAAKVDAPTLVVLTAVDEVEWAEWTKELGPAFQQALQVDSPLPLDEARFTQTRKTLEFHRWAYATVAPRGVGPTKWTPDLWGGEHQVRRRFALLGQTLDGQRVWDVRRALEVLRAVPDLKNRPQWLQGHGDMAGIVLYAALFEPGVDRVDLWHPPASHRTGPTFLNVLRSFDLPQALALAFPRALRVYAKDEAAARSFDWPLQLQAALGQECLIIRQIGD